MKVHKIFIPNKKPLCITNANMQHSTTYRFGSFFHYASLLRTSLSLQLFQTFNIYAANGSVIPLTPGSVSSSGQTTGTTGSIGIGTASAVAGSQTSQINQTGLTGQTSQPGEGGVGGSISATITAGTQGATNAAAAGHSGVFHGAYVYNREKPYYIPSPGENSHIIARKMVYLESRGLSRVRKYKNSPNAIHQSMILCTLRLQCTWISASPIPSLKDN